MAAGEKKGRVVLECPQKIPCNPCVDACRFGAVIKDGLNAIPRVDAARCTGCKLCVAACPGQAIFYLAEDEAAGATMATFPFEYLPRPQRGQRVTALDAGGEELGEGVVTAVAEAKAYNGTALVTVRMQGKAGLRVRAIRREWEGGKDE